MSKIYRVSPAKADTRKENPVRKILFLSLLFFLCSDARAALDPVMNIKSVLRFSPQMTFEVKLDQTKQEKVEELIDQMEYVILLKAVDPEKFDRIKKFVNYLKYIKPQIREEESWEENKRRIEGKKLDPLDSFPSLEFLDEQ